MVLITKELAENLIGFIAFSRFCVPDGLAFAAKRYEAELRVAIAEEEKINNAHNS